MNILQITISLFLVLESLNILILYTNPKSSKGNGVGIFNSIHSVEGTNPKDDLVRYLIRWVANAKVIFVALGIVIVIFENETIQLYTSIAFALSILMYFVTLHPIIVKLDNEGEITPIGYSKTLAMMIVGFILIFVVGIVVHLLT